MTDDWTISSGFTRCWIRLEQNIGGAKTLGDCSGRMDWPKRGVCFFQEKWTAALAFQQLIPPDGIAEKVEATLEGVQPGKDANLKLDSEGGAEATTPKTRHLATAVSLTLAAASAGGDENNVDSGVDDVKTNTGAQVAGGVNGFKVVGIVLA